jgi:hypothetical protein
MARHEIPTHLEVEDKLLGPLTARDALVVLVGASAAYGVAENPALSGEARLLIALAVSVVSLAFALVKVRGRPLEGWLLAGLAYIANPRRSTWAPRPPEAPVGASASTADTRRYHLRVRWRTPPKGGRARRTMQPMGTTRC